MMRTMRMRPGVGGAAGFGERGCAVMGATSTLPIVLAVLVLQTVVVAADDGVEAPAIVERALERAAAQRESGMALDFEYTTAGVFESLDRDGNVTRTETARRLRYALEGHLYAEVVERDGKLLDGDDVRAERERKAEFLREVRRHAARGARYEPEEMSVDFDRELMARYDVRLAGTEEVRGHACWVIAFEPRDGRLPDRRRIDKALNRSTGRIWIAQDDYGVVRVDFTMQRPFRWVLGLVGTLRHATGQFDFQRLEPGLWMPVVSRIEFDVRLFFGIKSMRSRIRSEWLEHRPAGATAGLP